MNFEFGWVAVSFDFAMEILQETTIHYSKYGPVPKESLYWSVCPILWEKSNKVDYASRYSIVRIWLIKLWLVLEATYR